MTHKELIKIREDKKLTKGQFAALLGISAMMQGRYEGGKIKIPDHIAEKALALAAAKVIEDVAAGKKEEPKKEEPKKEAYSGPSVVSYALDGRKASRLSIPAYRCLGSGHVTVIITVDPSGNVLNAKVQEDASSSDRCLRDFAIRAARLSKFSASTSAPPRQIGNIVYMFIAQ